MTRTALRIISFILLAALVCWAGAVALRRVEARRWQPLPKGGEVKIYAITHGTEHRIESPRPSFRVRVSDAFRELLRGGSLKGFTSALQPGSQGWNSTSTNTPAIVTWLQVRGRKDTTLAREGILELSDGQTFRTHGGSGGSSGGFYYTDVQFPFVPFRDRTLRFSVEFEGKRLAFEAPNPGYNPSVPRWEASPLPQTQTAGEITITLRELTLKAGSNKYDAPWRAQPGWTITRNGEPANDWFSVSAEFLDAGGNVSRECGLLSEPAWKVRATLNRRNAYPYPDDAVHWLGTIHPDGEMTPAPEKYSLIPIDAEVQKSGILLAGIFGVGEFAINGTSVTAAGPVVKAPPGRSGYGTAWVDQAKSMHVTLSKPGAIIVTRYESAVLVLRDESGAPAKWHDATNHGSQMGSTQVYPLPKEAIRLGTADKAPVKFEFLVRPPEPPKTKEPAAKR